MKIFVQEKIIQAPRNRGFWKIKNYRNVWDKIDFFIANDLNDYIGEVNG